MQKKSDSNIRFSQYIKFRNEYLYLLFDKVQGKPSNLFLPNDIFKILNELPVRGDQKAFAFCLYYLVKLTNWKKQPMSISKIKELWGYAPRNKTLNKLVKSGGILDTHGITRTVVQGVKNKEGVTKSQHKEIAFDIDKDRGFFQVGTEIMLFSMFESEKVGTIGFYIYCFLCKASQVQGKGQNLATTAFDYIANGTGLCEKTVRTYIKSLEELGLIKVRRGDSIHNGNYGEFKKETNQYSINREFNVFTYYNGKDAIVKDNEVAVSTFIKIKSYPTFFDLCGECLDFLDD